MITNIRGLLASALVPVVSATMTTAACAQAVRDFDIPAGRLEPALVAFASQADVQLLYTAELVGGLQTEGVVGRHSPEAALTRLLEGTGISWSTARPGVIVLRRPQASRAEEAARLGDVLVTGTLLRGPQESPSPVTVITRGELDASGAGAVSELLTSLPQNYAGSATPGTLLTLNDTEGSNSSLSTGINLRGLGEDSTLVLVNGRRVAGTGSRGEFADLSAVPGAALERVDVLLDGASAL